MESDNIVRCEFCGVPIIGGLPGGDYACEACYPWLRQTALKEEKALNGVNAVFEEGIDEETGSRTSSLPVMGRGVAK